MVIRTLKAGVPFFGEEEGEVKQRECEQIECRNGDTSPVGGVDGDGQWVEKKDSP